MKVSFLGATKFVTGSNFLLETKKKKILIDCGMFQGSREFEEKNKEEFLYDPKKIDFVILTHAHLDHTGRLPILVKRGFTGKIFATPPTFDLSRLILEDAMNIQEEELFSEEDLLKTMEIFETVDYHTEVKIDDGFSFKLLDAGHILGSAIVEVFTEGKKIVFSGDLGNNPTPLLRQTEIPSSADAVIIESTYGNKIHKDLLSRKDLLEDTIEETIKNKGVLMIPSFAIERTQEILYEMNELVENCRIPQVPVFVDSPLAIKSIDVYKKYDKYYNKEASYLLRSGDKIFEFKNLILAESTEESKKINDVPPPKIIIAGSGMSNGGRILHHEKRYLPDPKSTILFVGFQVEGTLGRKIQDGAKEVEIMGEKVPVLTKRVTIDSYSAHADKNMLFRWLYSIKSSSQIKEEHILKKVFVVHGEEEPSNSLAQTVKDKLGIEAIVPNFGESFEI